jgi:hypothetical protein
VDPVVLSLTSATANVQIASALSLSKPWQEPKESKIKAVVTHILPLSMFPSGCVANLAFDSAERLTKYTPHRS